MKMNRSSLFSLVSGILALGVSSCTYDPYSSSGYYRGGYGDGYGYGGSGFSTSFFVSTGSPRWAYDPYAGAYYDYSRRCYYDPYLSGYYPVGYRPRYVYGSPYPYGYSSGGTYCQAPSNVRSYNLTNYRDRSERYRSLGRSWSSDVQVDTTGNSQYSSHGERAQSSPYGYGTSQSPSYDSRSSTRFGNFGDSSGTNRRAYTEPDNGNRNSHHWDSEHRDDRSNRNSPPSVTPSVSIDHSHREWINPNGASPEAPRSVTHESRSVPESEPRAGPEEPHSEPQPQRSDGR